MCVCMCVSAYYSTEEASDTMKIASDSGDDL